MQAKCSAPLFRCGSAILILLAALGVQAKNLGTWGKTFAIQEPDLLQVIETKLAHLQNSGKLDALQKTWQQQAKTAVKRPKPVSHIRHTSQPRTFYFDPSVTIPEDFKDHQGTVFQKAGTRVNPLKTVSLTKALLFLDGDDAAQIQWALAETKTRNHKTTLILVKGSPTQHMAQTKQRFYFDQGGRLVEKFGIEQVPARVSQAGLLLKVEELKP